MLSGDTLFWLIYRIDLQIDFLIEGLDRAKDPKTYKTTLVLKDRQDKAYKALEKVQAY